MPALSGAPRALQPLCHFPGPGLRSEHPPAPQPSRFLPGSGESTELLTLLTAEFCPSAATAALGNLQPLRNHFRKGFTAVAVVDGLLFLSRAVRTPLLQVPPPALGRGPSVLWKPEIFYSLCTTRYHRKGPSVKKPAIISQIPDNHDPHTLPNKDKPKKTPKANSFGTDI